MEISYYNEISALFALAKGSRGQGSMEYIMMLSAVSIIIVVALAMIMQLKGTAIHAFNGTSGQNIAAQLSNELANLSSK